MVVSLLPFNLNRSQLQKDPPYCVTLPLFSYFHHTFLYWYYIRFLSHVIPILPCLFYSILTTHHLDYCSFTDPSVSYPHSLTFLFSIRPLPLRTLTLMPTLCNKNYFLPYTVGLCHRVRTLGS